MVGQTFILIHNHLYRTYKIKQFQHYFMVNIRLIQYHLFHHKIKQIIIILIIKILLIISILLSLIILTIQILQI